MSEIKKNQRSQLYIVLLPQYFGWKVRFFSHPRIDSFEYLVETIQNICKPKKDFKITWTCHELYGDARIAIASDEELKAAQDHMMKRCKCQRKKECDGRLCANIELLIKYLSC